MSSFFLLPDELIIQILKYFILDENDQTLRGLSHVNKLFYDIARPLIHAKVSVDGPKAYRLIKQMLQEHLEPDIHFLQVSRKSISQLIFELKIDCRGERYACDSDSDDMQNVTEIWTKDELRYLSEITWDEDDRDLSEKLLSVYHITNLTLILFHMLPNLRHVDLSMVLASCNAGFMHNYMDHKMKLAVSPTNSEGAPRNRILGLQHLQSLYCHSTEDSALDISILHNFLIQTPNLREVKCELAQDGVKFFSTLSPPRQLNITKLSFLRCTLQTEFLVDIISACTALTTFEYCFEITEWSRIIEMHCPKIVSALIVHAHSLQHLRLRVNKPIFEEEELYISIVDSLEGLKALRYLDINGYLLLDDEVHELLVDKLPTGLETLIVDDCDQWGDAWQGGSLEAWKFQLCRLQEVRMQKFPFLERVLVGIDSIEQWLL